tara:strand:- start:226 stop:393 length:168 start_codon:yes stop_codon:yes gene_type:complete
MSELKLCPECKAQAKKEAENRWYCAYCGMMFHMTISGPVMGNGHGQFWRPKKGAR